MVGDNCYTAKKALLYCIYNILSEIRKYSRATKKEQLSGNVSWRLVILLKRQVRCFESIDIALGLLNYNEAFTATISFYPYYRIELSAVKNKGLLHLSYDGSSPSGPL
jgi:hypothetical protein